MDKIIGMLDKAFSDGYKEAVANAEEAAHWDEVAKQCEEEGLIKITES